MYSKKLKRFRKNRIKKIREKRRAERIHSETVSIQFRERKSFQKEK